jgi:hypothetical protein
VPELMMSGANYICSYSLTRELDKLGLWTFHQIHKVFIIGV